MSTEHPGPVRKTKISRKVDKRPQGLSLTFRQQQTTLSHYSRNGIHSIHKSLKEMTICLRWSRTSNPQHKNSAFTRSPGPVTEWPSVKCNITPPLWYKHTTRDTRLQNQQYTNEHTTKIKYGIRLDRNDAIANTHNYHPFIFREAIKIVKYPHNFSTESKFKLNKVWCHLFSFKFSS